MEPRLGVIVVAVKFTGGWSICSNQELAFGSNPQIGPFLLAICEVFHFPGFPNVTKLATSPVLPSDAMWTTSGIRKLPGGVCRAKRPFRSLDPRQHLRRQGGTVPYDGGYMGAGGYM